MKKCINWALILITALSVGVLSSCSDDDDDKKKVDISFEGSWKVKEAKMNDMDAAALLAQLAPVIGKEISLNKVELKFQGKELKVLYDGKEAEDTTYSLEGDKFLFHMEKDFLQPFGWVMITDYSDKQVSFTREIDELTVKTLIGAIKLLFPDVYEQIKPFEPLISKGIKISGTIERV